MALSNNPHTYLDVRQVLDAAVSAGGGRYTPPERTRAAATHWCHRAYKFRKLLFQERAKNAEKFPELGTGTPYDHLKFTVDGETVVISTRVMGKLETLDGQPLEPKAQADTEGLDDELVDEAAALIGRLAAE